MFTLDEAMKAQRRSRVSLTSALDGVGGQRHAPSALPLERHPVTTVQETGHGPGFDPRTVQPILIAIPTELSRPIDIV